MSYDKKEGTEKLNAPKGTNGMNVKKQRREQDPKSVPADVNGPGLKNPKMRQSKRFEG